MENEIIKALGQVPRLVDVFGRSMEDSERKFKMLADAALKRPQAEIPPSEIEKVSDAAANAVSRTRCATPDTDEVSRLVAENITKFLTESVKTVATEAVKEAVEGTPVKVEHHHTHTTLKYMCQMAEETLRNWILGLAIYSIILSFAGILIGCFFFNGEKNLGSEYAEIYYSKYTTDEEREMLKANTYVVGFMPKEFDNTPKLVKQKIKRNKQILKARQYEAERNKGKYSKKVSLER